jgi:hypothetical protein
MERFKLTKYVTEKISGYKKGQFVNTQKRGVGVVDEVNFERISDGWSFGLQSEYGYICIAICHIANEEEKATFARQQEDHAAAEKKQFDRKTAREQLNQVASQAKEQGTQVEREDIGEATTRIQVKLDSYCNYYFLIGETAIWYVEMHDVYPTIWHLDYDAHLAEELQRLITILA